MSTRSVMLPVVLVAGALGAGAGAPASALAACPHETSTVRTATVPQLRAAVVCLLNEARSARRLPPLASDPRLSAAAQGHAEDMRDRRYFGHQHVQGQPVEARIADAGYAWSSVGETIALGPRTPFEVTQAWLASAGHCSAVLGAFNDAGVGLTSSLHWVLDLGVAQGATPPPGTGRCPASLGRTAAGPAPAVAITPIVLAVDARARPRRLLRVVVVCPAGRPACRGSIRARVRRRGTVLGRRPFAAIGPGRARAIYVRLTPGGERLLRRAGRRIVRVEVASPGVPSHAIAVRLPRPV